MEVTYDPEGRIMVSDDRFAHFLPALLAPSLMRAGGSAIKWLANKALGAGAAVGRSAIEQMATQLAPQAAEEEAGEQTGEEEFFGEEAFDVYYDESTDTAHFVNSDIGSLPDEVADALTGYVAGYMDECMSDGIYVPDDDSATAYDAYSPDENYAHFKKFKKKFKKMGKLAGKLGKMAGKLGPLASLVPGAGTLVSAASMVGGMASKKGRRSSARRAVAQHVPQELGEVASLFSDGDPVAAESRRVDRLARMAGDVR